ncbi:gamma-glutamyltransferase [Leptobacterium flavescens]|uniref:Glutathione hydrolase proenzyme n=1 Tax=Leptobacterium flavescens TaxID=472055 RepID=A0A6P0UMV4_9FLAO|nr:gamma-glutamyltransferase [Leptobacterium flavescens]NER13179.1 gamma-glutamyltransferase [Leptobacterium flavescens]
MRIGLKIKWLFLFLIACSCADSQPQAEIKGSVASAHPLATKAGMEVLEKGGNAFDAAIAVAATLNVVEPMMSGIGGYGTIMIYDASSDQVRFLNSSGRFPVKTNTDLMREPTPDFMKNRVGPKSISTPGNLNAWADMHATYGKLDWKELFGSAITHAENGFSISPATARWINIAFEDFSPYTRSFYGKDGEPLQQGDKLVQADLAKTFKTVASEGVEPFYKGTLAEAIDKKMEEAGSFLSLEDLQNNKAEWWKPLKFDYKGYEVYTASLPANSFPAFLNLGIMAQFSDEKLEHNSPEYLHLFAEMTKESYKARLAYSFDPEVKIAPIDSLLSEPALKAAAAAINREKATEFVPPFSGDSRNTTHFVVVDKWGNTVSATQTLGNLFGSRIMVEGTGVWLNNSMAYSTFEPKGNPMDAFPGRHKLSGDCPIIIMKDGKLWAALGTPGGHTITQNVPQIIFNLIDFDMSMQQAIDAPKIAFVEPDRIVADPDLNDDLINSLREKGHNVAKRTIGNANGIKLIRNEKGEIIGYEAGMDKRGEGRASVVDH